MAAMTDSTTPVDPVAEAIEVLGQLRELTLYGVPGTPGNFSLLLAQLRNRAGLTSRLLGDLAAILQDQHDHGGVACSPGSHAAPQVAAAVAAIDRARADAEILASALNTAHKATSDLQATPRWVLTARRDGDSAPA